MFSSYNKQNMHFCKSKDDEGKIIDKQNIQKSSRKHKLS